MERGYPLWRDGSADSLLLSGETQLNLMFALCVRLGRQSDEPLADFQVTGTFVADVLSSSSETLF